MEKSGVCYDLDDTPFCEEWMGIFFYFSSHTHQLKFRRQASERASWLTDSLSRRFHVRVCASKLAVLQLYTQIERRGFHVSYKGCNFYSPDDIQLSVDWF